MTYLDFERLESIDPRAFRARKPYPWANPAELIRPDLFEELIDSVPDVSRFERIFGKERKFGQKSHDRFALEYSADLALEKPWAEFIAELQSDRYQKAIARLAGRRTVDLRFHWHLTPRGCSVSPHCDSKHKLGSHLFYLHRESEWMPEWGGGTELLDADRKIDRKSAPDFDDFDRVTTAEHIGNRSLLFIRRDDSWHGVRELKCPEGQLRKVFIVVIEEVPVLESIRRVIGVSRGQ